MYIGDKRVWPLLCIFSNLLLFIVSVNGAVMFIYLNYQRLPLACESEVLLNSTGGRASK